MKNFRVNLFCTAAVTVIGLPMAAHAQEAAEDPAVQASEAGNLEQEAGSDDNVILVTALKREQDLQDVALSISAIGGEQLQDSGITDIQALQVAVPNITIGTSFGYSNLFVRGLGLNSVFANVDPSVTMYEDGAIISQPAAQLFSFFDLDRVEVLRGPQGTLYGRNSTGGQINLITAKPSSTFEGFARVQVGNYARLESEGAVGGPITDAIQGRLSYFFSTCQGFGTNVITGNDVNDYNTRALRAQLRFAPPSSSFDLLLSGEYGRQDDSANALLFKRESYPGNAALPSPGAGGFPMTGDNRDYASDVDPSNQRETWSVTATASLDLTDNISLTNILNYRAFDMNMVQDLDLSSVRTSAIQDFIFNSEHYSEEFQANFDFDRFQAIGGLYYFHEKLDHQNAIAEGAKVGEFDPNSPGAGRRVVLLGQGTTESWAAYWNASFEVTDWLTVRGGGRYTHDRREIDNDNYIWIPLVAPCAPPQSVTAGPFTSSSGSTRIQCFNPSLDEERTFEDYTNEVGVDVRPTEDLMLYYTYSEGFKAGTGQLGTTQTTRPLIIDPENVTNHEIGLKSTFGDGRYTLNLSAYSYRVDGIQLDRTIVGGPTGFITIFENASYQDGRGIELDATFEPSDVFRGNISVAYQDTELGPFVTTNPLFPATPVNIEGNRARNAPDWAGAAHLEYDIPTSNGGNFTVVGDASYKGEQFFSEFNDQVLREGDYWIFDAQLRYAFPDDRWQASLWIRNIGDVEAEGANYALATGRVIGRTFTDPRTYGASLRYSF